jgi:ABC-type transporter Mla subunit MlaD
MKYWILLISLFLFGCGGGEKEEPAAATAEKMVEDVQEAAGDAADAVDENAATAGKEISDALNEAQDKAEEVGDVLQEKKEELDEAIDEAEGKLKD